MRILLCLFAAAAALSAAAAPVTVLHHDFQKIPANPKTKVPINWNLYQQWEKGGTVQFIREKENRFLRMDDVTANGEIGISRRFPFKHGQYYRLTARVRAVPGKADSHFYLQLSFFLRDGRGPENRSIRLVPPRDGKYHTYSILHQAPDNAQTGVIYFFSNKTGVGAIDAAELKLEQSDVPFPPSPRDPQTKFGALQIKPRELYLTTDLADSRIVYGPEHKLLAQDLQKAVAEATGKTPVLVPDHQMQIFRKLPANCIMLGNKDSNLAIEQLYFQHHVILDAVYPGVGGWLVRSCHNPFGDKHNVLFAGGSDLAGTRKAAARLAEIIRTTQGKPGFLAEIHPAKPFPVTSNARVLPVWDASFGWNRISKTLAMLYLTNDKRYADEFLRLAFPDAKTVKLLQGDDEDYDDARDPLVKPYHYRSIYMMLYWDMVEECPHFTDAQRAAVTRKFYDQLQFWRTFGYQGLYHIFNTREPHKKLGDRHYLWEAVSVYVLGRYFDWHYPCYDSREALRVVRDIFAPLRNSVTCNAGTLEWFGTFIESPITYAALSEGKAFPGKRALHVFAKTQFSISDLSSGDWATGQSAPSTLGKLAAILDDRDLAALSRRRGEPLSQFRLGQSFYPRREYKNTMLHDSVGQWIWPEYDSSLMEYPFVPQDLPVANIKETISYRNTPTADGDFILLDNKYDIGGRAPFHNFNIASFVLNGQPLLRGYANQLQILCDGLAAREKAFYADVRHAGKAGSTAYLSARINRFNQHDWTRTLVLRQNRFLLAVDRVVPRKDTQSSRLENNFCSLPHYAPTRTAQSEFHLSDDHAPGRSPTCPISYDRVKILQQVDYYNKRLGSFLNCTCFYGLAKGQRLVLPFSLEKDETLDLTLQIIQYAGQRGGIRLDVNGKAIPGNILFRSQAYWQRPVKLGRHTLKAGRHELGITVIEAADSSGTIQLNLLNFFGTTPEYKKGQGGYLLASTDGRTALTPVGRVLFSSNTGMQFVIERPAKAGRPMDFETILRPGPPVPGGASAARQGDLAAFRMPETALLQRFPDGGFTVAMADWQFGFQVKDIQGKFTSQEPFNYEYTPGKLVIDRNGKSEVHSVTLPAPDLAKAETILRDNARNSASVPDVMAPFKPHLWQTRAQNFVGHAIDLPDRRMAAASGKKVLILNKENGTVEREIPTGAVVGALHYWEKTGLLLAGCQNEKLYAWKLDGTKVWEFTSQMAKQLAESAKYYWFKSVYPGIYALEDAELEPGKPLLFAGSAGTTEILTQEGKLAARFWDTWGPVTRFAAVPATAKKHAMVLGERRYGSWPNVYVNFARDGKLVHFNYKMHIGADQTDMGSFGFSSIGRTRLQTVRFTENGPLYLLGAFNGSQNRIGIWDLEGRILRDVDLGPGRMAATVSYETPALSVCNVTALTTAPDGKERVILVATATGNIMVFDRHLKLRKMFTMPETPTTLLAVPNAEGKIRMVIGLRGRIVFTDLTGRLLGKTVTPGSSTALLPGNAGEVIACTNQGVITCVRIP